MGGFIRDEDFLNDNIFLYEKRLESQYTIFFDDKAPTFTTYYHINNINSIADTGFLNVENILGSESPLRFQKVESFPIYGIDSIKMELTDEDVGLQTAFDGEGIILPNTIKPLPHDFFTITYLGKRFIFMITEVNYGTIKSNDFYSINFTLRSENDASIIENQVLDKYKCIYHNIGTDDKCLIRSDEYEKLQKLLTGYKKLANTYMTVFYDNTYNSFIYSENNVHLYDAHLSKFINDHKLFAEPNTYKTIHLNNEDWYKAFDINHEDCIYTKIEDVDLSTLDTIRTLHWNIGYADSIFEYYHMSNVRSVHFNKLFGEYEYIPDSVITNIKDNLITDDTNVLEEILIKHFNKSYTTIYDLDIDKFISYRMHDTYYDFIMIPISLYCVSKVIKEFMTKIDTEIE